MKKFRVNWLVVARNIAIVGLIVVCNQSMGQMKENDAKLEMFKNEIVQQENVNSMMSNHRLFAKYGHNRTSFIRTRAVEKVENKPIIEEVQEDNYLGKFKITHYCACKKCCGPNAQGITASGKKVQEGVTIAVDPKVIKLGTKVNIDGYGERIAQDTGSAIKGNKIDVYIADHQRALEMGVKYENVYLIK